MLQCTDSGTHTSHSGRQVTHTNTHTQTHTYTYTDTHTFIRTAAHKHIYANPYTRAHEQTHTHTHTHTLYVWAATRNYADFRIHRHTSSTCICTYDVNTVLWIVYPHKTPTQTGVHGNPERHTLTYEQL